MKFPTLLTLLSLLLLCTSVSAQNVPQKAKTRATERAERKANNRVDQKVDKAVDDAFNAVGNLFKKRNKKKNRQDSTGNNGSTVQTGNEESGTAPTSGAQTDDDRAANILGSLFGGNKDFEPFTNEATFSADMNVISTKRNGKQEVMNMRLAVAPTQIGQQVNIVKKGETTTTLSIFDTQTGTTTLVTEADGERTAMRMRTPNLSGLMEEMDTENYMEGITIEETSETKVIDGYNTRKYLSTNENDGSVTTSWITTEIPLRHEALAQSMAAFTGAKISAPDGAPEIGFPLRSTSITKKGERIEMTYKNVKVGEAAMDTSILNLDGVEIMEIPGF
ncbi:hypothetical protein [Neolewinella antarctica]|uniref:DUF4412 domain-containing protein n=1 Tax=Neolewinella antarctica TaxID=442734 RepID=A0ABX0XEF4_9BACT|nr:hypothetical protein [Neolewinella antarctica]NJC27269.1 hypothetical protein [Neolewinella antarctica]